MSMAGSLSSTKNPLKGYDVFLSFRGKDTCKGFTNRLYVALCLKKISTFIGDQIVRGDEISPFLLNAVKTSKISVIIFSKNYASSRWCLQELEQILHCMKTEKQIVIPVFYHVDPSDVRNQTGSFGDGFAELEKNTKVKLEMLQRWKTALNEAASLAGWTVNDQKYESILIEETLDDILMRLNKLSLSDYTDLVGIEFAIKEIESLLDMGSNGVSKIGIWGIGGVGKTTIAHVVFNKNFRDFEGSYFAENVREKSEKDSRLTHLKEKLLSTILEDRDPNIGLTFTRKRIEDKKVLIVFDDVTSFMQIENLIGNLRLSSKSQIIITTRDKQVLRNCGVNDDCIYKVEGLGEKEAHILFNRYAFKQESPIAGYMKLSKKAVTYTKCLPLALKVLGSHFFSKEKDFWESAIEKLEKSPHLNIHEVLRVSYDGLDKEEKDIFLDIACFFKGKNIHNVTGILNACDLFAKQGVQVLIDKCLVSVEYNKRLMHKIMMHDLLQQMGQEIVKRECPEEPGRRSRLWIEADIRHVLTENTGTELVQGIMLNFSEKEILCCPQAFSKMINLRLLKIRNVQLLGGLHYLSNKLCLLDWEGFPLKSLPPNLQLEKIFKLKLGRSRIEQLQQGIKPFNNLESISFRECKHLIKTPDFALAPNLKDVNLNQCKMLREVHPSLLLHKKITNLYMKGCTSLTTLPNQIHMESLCDLQLTACYKLEKFPEIVGSMDLKCWLNLRGTAIKVLPKSIELWSGLQRLELDGSSKFDNLPETLGQLKRLDYLSVEESATRRLMSSICLIKNLEHLYISGFQGRPSNSLSPLSLIKIFRLPTLSGFWRSLRHLSLSDCNMEEEMIPNNFFDSFSSLTHLTLSKNNFVSLPGSIKHLCMLRYLNLNGCKRLRSLPELPSKIQLIHLNGCVALETTSNVLRLCYSTVVYFRCINCSKLTYCNNLASSMPKEFLKAMSKVTVLTMLGFGMVIPGSEIPEWFQHQSETPSIKIERPPYSYDNMTEGYAVCCVFDVHEHQPTHSQDDYDPDDYNIYCTVNNETSELFRPKIDFDKKMFKTVSDHLWLFYFFDYLYNEDFVELSFDSNAPGFAVKRCGIHPVYEKELKELKPRANKSSSSSFWNSCELDEDFLGSTVDVDCDRSEDEPISETITTPNFINGEPSSRSSAISLDLNLMVGSTVIATTEPHFKRLQSSAASLDLNLMIGSTLIDTIEPYSKRLKICNNTNKYEDDKEEVEEFSRSTSQPTGFTIFDLNEFPIDDEDEPQPKRLKEFKLF